MSISWSQQSITMNVPENPAKRAILEKLMQTRVRNLMAQPAVTQSNARRRRPCTCTRTCTCATKESNAC